MRVKKKNILTKTAKKKNKLNALTSDNRYKARNIEEKPPTVQDLQKAGEELPDFGDGLNSPPRITMFNEGNERFLEKEDNSPLVWKVIKGTASAYKKNKKK